MFLLDYTRLLVKENRMTPQGAMIYIGSMTIEF